MDWDDFMKIPGCSVAFHSDVKLVRPTVSAAPPTHDQHPEPQRIDVIQPAPASVETEKSPPPHRPQVPFRTAQSFFKCRHAGCLVEYDPEANSEKSCEYHEGSAGFRDTKKFWTCCGASSYDWDEFMKIPKCRKGKHEPKMVDA